MIELPFPPALILIAGALLLPLLKGVLRQGLLLLAPVAVLALVFMLPEKHSVTVGPFLGMTLTPLQITVFGKVFAIIFCIMAFAGNLFALKQATNTELSAAMLYGGSAIGVALAGDLITLLVFWELMAIGSTIVIWSNQTEAARKAGFRYIMVHLLGGVVLMIGITGYYLDTGSIAFTAMKTDSIAQWLILIGFLINVGAPPLSAWISDAYPEASPSGAVFLSAFTTKTAVYVLLTAFAGEKILIYIGLYMIFYGIIYALLENDIRRILAYSIVNQVGFMVAGIGIGTPLALNGVAALAFCHIIYKALLLMSAGSVLLQTGKRKFTDLGGLYQTMPVTAVCGIIGALTISAFPLTSGFISKSMISSAVADQHLATVWFILTAATACSFLYVGIKFPWFVFFRKDSGLRPADPPANMRYAMYLLAFLCIFLGVYPQPLYALLAPLPPPYNAYTAEHILTQLQLLLFAGLAFFWLLPLMKNTLTISLDFDWVYRKLLFSVGDRLVRITSLVYGKLTSMLQAMINLVVTGPHSRLKRLGSWCSTVEGMLWIGLFLFGLSLAGYLLVPR